MAGRSMNSFSVTINKSPEEVFTYISDVSKHAEWSPKAYRVEGTSGPVKVGDTFSSVGSIPGDKSHRNEVTVTECSAPTRLVLESKEKDQLFINTFDLKAEGSGTLLTRSMDAPKPPFPLSAIFPLIMAAFIKPDVNKGLNNLKVKLEQG